MLLEPWARILWNHSKSSQSLEEHGRNWRNMGDTVTNVDTMWGRDRVGGWGEKYLALSLLLTPQSHLSIPASWIYLYVSLCGNLECAAYKTLSHRGRKCIPGKTRQNWYRECHNSYSLLLHVKDCAKCLMFSVLSNLPNIPWNKFHYSSPFFKMRKPAWGS